MKVYLRQWLMFASDWSWTDRSPIHYLPSNKSLCGIAWLVSLLLIEVHPKVIRDIWNRKTWLHVTEPLWYLDPDTKFSPASRIDDVLVGSEHLPSFPHSHRVKAVALTNLNGIHQTELESKFEKFHSCQKLYREEVDWGMKIYQILGQSHQSEFCQHFNCEICNTATIEYEQIILENWTLFSSIASVKLFGNADSFTWIWMLPVQ